MSRNCTVCSHPDAISINEALVLEKKSNRAITRQYGLHHDAVRRHREHIPQLLVKAHEAEQAAEADKLLMDVRRLQAKTLIMLQEAERAGDLRTALSAVREARNNIALLAEMRGELDRRPVINIVTLPEYIEVRTLIVRALEPYPEARMAVVRALESGGNGRG